MVCPCSLELDTAAAYSDRRPDVPEQFVGPPTWGPGASCPAQREPADAPAEPPEARKGRTCPARDCQDDVGAVKAGRAAARRVVPVVRGARRRSAGARAGIRLTACLTAAGRSEMIPDDGPGSRRGRAKLRWRVSVKRGLA